MVAVGDMDGLGVAVIEPVPDWELVLVRLTVGVAVVLAACRGGKGEVQTSAGASHCRPLHVEVAAPETCV